jgi:hypothetical protein
VLFTITILIPLYETNKDKKEFQIFKLPINNSTINQDIHQKEILIEKNILNNEGEV